MARLAGAEPSAKRQRNRQARDEEERWKDDVGESHAVGVGRHVKQERRGSGDAGHLVHEQHQQHVEPAQQIDRQEARRPRHGRSGQAARVLLRQERQLLCEEAVRLRHRGLGPVQHVVDQPLAVGQRARRLQSM